MQFHFITNLCLALLLQTFYLCAIIVLVFGVGSSVGNTEIELKRPLLGLRVSLGSANRQKQFVTTSLGCRRFAGSVQYLGGCVLVLILPHLSAATTAGVAVVGTIICGQVTWWIGMP